METAKEIKKILVIRFRQVGDTILASAMCSCLKRSFPNAEVHIVLNSRIAPIFEHHPDIDKTITFSQEENKNFFKYISRIWSVMHSEKYDVIIDMRATIRTLLFSLFSLRTPIRVGRRKKYSTPFLTHCVDFPNNIDMVRLNQLYADALSQVGTIIPVNDFRLYVSKDEKDEAYNYMQKEGIDFSRPIMLVGVTTKILEKRWNIDYMTEVIKRILERYKNLQLIFNYAPDREEEDAREIYNRLGKPEAIKIDVQCKSLRSLMALCSNCSFYFGNEGGSRHLAHALEIPSFAIFSPNANKACWMPKNSTPADGIEPCDIIKAEEAETLSREEMFNRITPDIVCERLFPLLDKLS